jgi:hypothetical protein
VPKEKEDDIEVQEEELVKKPPVSQVRISG